MSPARRATAVRPATASFYERAVQRAAEQVAASLDQALNLEALARGAALSVFHFHRVFRGMLGETPLELQRRLRLERAASRLLETREPVTALAFEAGYQTHESFTRAFRARYHCAPSQWRRRPPEVAPRRRIELAARSGIHFDPRVAAPAFAPRRGGAQMTVTVKEMPALRLATVQHFGAYNRINEAFHRLAKLALAANLASRQVALIAIYHDDPETTPGPRLRSEAGLAVSPRARLPAELRQQCLHSGRYACATHLGPYERLGDAWAQLMGSWLPHSGLRVGEGPSYELYRNTPAEVPENELMTELYLPVTGVSSLDEPVLP